MQLFIQTRKGIRKENLRLLLLLLVACLIIILVLKGSKREAGADRNRDRETGDQDSVTKGTLYGLCIDC